jgi:hypothetical protein
MDKKIGNFNTIFDNPLEWGRSLCGSKMRMNLAIIFHIIVLVTSACFFIAVAIAFDDRRHFLMKMLPLFGTIVLLGNGFSFYYIYVIRRLIKMIDRA